MKKVKLFMFLLLLPLLLLGCIKKEEVAKIEHEDTTENIDFKVDNIKLSKSFQNTEAYGQVLKSVKSKDEVGKVKILASLGLMESSSAKVDKVLKNNNQLDIYISSVFEEKDIQLSIPQLTLEFNSKDLPKTEDIKVNIINTNSKPIKVKYALNDILAKMQTHFKISANSNPKVNLIKKDELLVWEIVYHSIFDKDSANIPMIDLFTSVDANTGEVLESKKSFISNSIDSGKLIDYLNGYLIYKKNANDHEELWAYNVETKEKNMIFTSNSPIIKTSFSPDGSSLAVLEGKDSHNSLYLVNIQEPKAYMVILDGLSPYYVEFKDQENLVLLFAEKENTQVYNYNSNDSTLNLLANVEKNIDSLALQDDIYLLVAKEESKKSIYETKDFKDFKYIDQGYSPRFINESKFAYLKVEPNDSSSTLYVKNLNNQYSEMIEGNIIKFDLGLDQDLLLLKGLPNQNQYTLYHYSKDGHKTELTDSITADLDYNQKDSEIYIGVNLPTDIEKYTEYIYSIKLDNKK